jgi:hypothetical protein
MLTLAAMENGAVAPKAKRITGDTPYFDYIPPILYVTFAKQIATICNAGAVLAQTDHMNGIARHRRNIAPAITGFAL